MINKPLPTFPSPGSRLGPPPGLMSSLELDALSQQAAQAGLLADNLELLLRDAGDPKEACMQRYLQRAEQQRQLVCHMRADLQALQAEQRERLGERQGTVGI